MADNEFHEELVEGHAGDVGARRTTVGIPAEEDSMGSINMPQTRPGAYYNELARELDNRGHEAFIPAHDTTGGDVTDVTGQEEERAAEARAYIEDGWREQDDEVKADLAARARADEWATARGAPPSRADVTRGAQEARDDVRASTESVDEMRRAAEERVDAAHEAVPAQESSGGKQRAMIAVAAGTIAVFFARRVLRKGRRQ